jgi:chaperonin GroES
VIKPLEDKVVVKPIIEKEKTSSSGLIIAALEKERPTEAIVVAVGPGTVFGNGDKMTIDLEVGDKVVYSKYQGTEITVNGEDLLILAYRDIFAVLKDQ